MHHRRACRRRERDRGRIERVIVDHVVRFPSHRVVDAGEGTLGRARPGSGCAPRRAVDRCLQSLVIDPRVDHLHACHLRSGSGVQVNVVASAREATCEIGQEGLRPAELVTVRARSGG